MYVYVQFVYGIKRGPSPIKGFLLKPVITAHTSLNPPTKQQLCGEDLQCASRQPFSSRCGHTSIRPETDPTMYLLELEEANRANTGVNYSTTDYEPGSNTEIIRTFQIEFFPPDVKSRYIQVAKTRTINRREADRQEKVVTWS